MNIKHLAFIIVFITCGAYSLYVTPAIAQEGDDSEVKAGWVRTLVPYITWKSKPRPVSICTLGRDAIYTSLLTKEKAEPSPTPVLIKQKSAGSSFDDCNILYISASEQEHIAAILKQVVSLPIFTVSSIPDFAELGGIVELVIKDSNISLKVNIQSAKKAHIVIDSDLLGFAEIVQ